MPQTTVPLDVTLWC